MDAAYIDLSCPCPGVSPGQAFLSLWLLLLEDDVWSSVRAARAADGLPRPQEIQCRTGTAHVSGWAYVKPCIDQAWMISWQPMP